MSPTSYQTAPPRDSIGSVVFLARFVNPSCFIFFRVRRHEAPPFFLMNPPKYVIN
jgi:hypothetical protein